METRPRAQDFRQSRTRALITASRLHGHKRPPSPRNQAAIASGVSAMRSTRDRLRLANVDPRLRDVGPTRTSPSLLCIAPPSVSGRKPAGRRWPRSQATNPRSQSPPASSSSRWAHQNAIRVGAKSAKCDPGRLLAPPDLMASERVLHGKLIQENGNRKIILVVERQRPLDLVEKREIGNRKSRFRGLSVVSTRNRHSRA